MADRFPLILNTSANQIQEIASGDSLDLTGTNIANAGIITAGNVVIGAATTDLIVNGDARITGILTIGTSSLTLDGPNNLVNVGTALTLGHTQGLQFHTQNLHSAGFEVNQINVSGASTMGGDVTFNGASSKNMVWDSSDGDLEFADNARLKFGNSDDFFLYHNGSHSYIKNSTNYLYYLATQHHFKNAANNELQARFQENGPVELYHDNTKRFETTTSGVTITGDGTFTGNVSIGGTLTYEDVTNIDSVGVITARSGINLTGGNITLGDTSDGSSDDVLIIGAGSDLKIYHFSDNSYIQNATGDLYIKSNADDLVLQAADDVLIRPQNGEDGIKVIGNGAVELYHDGTKMLETTSIGLTISGDVKIIDNENLRLGTDNDMLLYHTGSHGYIENSTGNMYIRGGGGQILMRANSAEDGLVIKPDGAVELFHNNSKKFETTSYGNLSASQIRVASSNTASVAFSVGDVNTGFYNAGSHAIGYAAQGTQMWNIDSAGNLRFNDDVKAYFGTSNDLSIYHEASGNTRIVESGSGELYLDTSSFRIRNAAGSEIVAKFISDGGCELYYDSAKKFQTTAAGILVTGNIAAGDDQQLQLGANGDLRLYHSTNESYIVNNLNQLYIRSNQGIYIQPNSNENGVVCLPNGATKLYHDNSVRIETLTEGAKVKRSSGGSTTLYIEGAEGGSAILDMFADDGDDNADKYRLSASSGGSFLMQNYSQGGWQNNLVINANNSIDLYYNNNLKFKTNTSGIEFEKCIVGGSIRTPVESDITYHQSFDPAAIFYPEGSYGNNNSPSNNRQAVIIGTTKGNWVDGNSSASHRSVGIKFSRIVNSSEYIRAGIAHDINSSEKYKIWTSYGDIHFRTRNGNDGNHTWEECDRDPLVMHHNGHVSMCHMPYAKYTPGSDSDSYKTDSTEHTVDGGSGTVENGMSVSTGNGRITVPYTGKYLITANIGLNSNNNTFRTRLNLMKNGADVIRTEHQEGTHTTGGWKDHVISAVIQMSANDYFSFDCQGKHDGGTYAVITCQMLFGTATT